MTREGREALFDLIYEAARGSRQAVDLLDAFVTMRAEDLSPEKLLPHLRRVEQLLEILDAGQRQARMLLDQTPLAVAIVDRESRIVECNALAEVELRDQGLFCRRNGCIEPVVGREKERLQRAIRRSIDRGRVGQGLVLHISDGAVSREVMVRSGFAAGVFAEELQRDMACVSFAPARAEAVARRRWLMNEYGLTRREAMLASLFVDTPSIAGLAQALRRSEHTIRSQIKSVFSKTGVGNQAELMRLLLGGGHAVTSHARVVDGIGLSSGRSELRLPDGKVLGYAEYGAPDGLPVFYFHSFTGCDMECAHDVPLLQRLGIRMIGVERPGYGRSTPDAAVGFAEWPGHVRCLANRLGVDRFHIVSMSGSSAYALACALHQPERVRALALISPMGEVRGAKDIQGMMPMNRMVYDMILHCPPRFIQTLARLMARAFSADPEAYLERVLPHIAPADQRVMAQVRFRTHLKETFVESRKLHQRAFSEDMIRYARPWNLELERMSVPVSIWHGEENRHIPLPMAKHLAARLPGCRTHWLAGEGYYLNYSHWEEILTDLLQLDPG